MAEVAKTAPTPMTETELLQIIGEYERSSIGSETASGATIGSLSPTTTAALTTAEIDRYDALNFYFGRPFGNETENSSSVVIPELRDTVEWIKPQLMRIFLGSRSPCVFDPEGANDVQQAQQETEAVNHVFMRLNDGPMVIHDYITDALLLRNGYIRTRVVEEDSVREETYTGLTEIALTELMQEAESAGQKVDVIEQREYPCPVEPPLGAPVGTPPQTVQCFDVRLRISGKRKRILVECVPPEELRIAAGTRGTNLDLSPYVSHVTERTRSDLIKEGLDADIVNQAQPGRPSWLELDSLARDQLVDQLQINDPAEFASQKVEFRSVTIQCDYDGDGIAERRQVLIVGDKIAANDVIEECPLSSGVPKRMPHRHSGISMHDELKDIQLIKSELARKSLDGLRLSIAGRIGVDWKNCNLTDLMTWRANGVVRTNGPPSNVLMPLTQPNNVMDQAIPFMQYVDSWRTMRTGVGEHTMGVDADALQDVTKGGQLAAMSAASLKIEMIARLLAEGLKDVFLKIHALLIRHQDEPMSFQMGSQWVEESPTKWRKRTRISANVGLGSGNREEARANLAMLTTMQEKIAQLGLVGPTQAYNSFKMGVALLGYEHPEQFAMDPASQEFQQWQQQHPPQPNPAIVVAQSRVEAAKVQAQAGVAKAQAETQAATARAQAEIAHSALQNHEDRQVTMAQTDSQMFVQLAKILATIVASQLKQDPSVNAGSVLRSDVQALEGRA